MEAVSRLSETLVNAHMGSTFNILIIMIMLRRVVDQHGEFVLVVMGRTEITMTSTSAISSMSHGGAED